VKIDSIYRRYILVQETRIVEVWQHDPDFEGFVRAALQMWEASGVQFVLSK
jgi:hypothetical protein